MILEIENTLGCDGNHTLQDIICSDNSKIHFVDGMSFVHQIQLKKFSTFVEFTDAFYKKKKYDDFSQTSVEGVDVFDRYDDIAIKFLDPKLRSRGQNPKQVTISSPF